MHWCESLIMNFIQYVLAELSVDGRVVEWFNIKLIKHGCRIIIVTIIKIIVSVTVDYGPREAPLLILLYILFHSRRADDDATTIVNIIRRRRRRSKLCAACAADSSAGPFQKQLKADTTNTRISLLPQCCQLGGAGRLVVWRRLRL